MKLSLGMESRASIRRHGGLRHAATLFLLTSAVWASAQKMPNCVHCGIPVVKGQEITVKNAGKTYIVRCMLCARDLATQYRGVVTVAGPTEDPARPLLLTSDEKGEWTSNIPGVVFLEDEGDHAFCNRWSRAFTSLEAFQKYVAENPQYKDSKGLKLAEWSVKEGKEMDHQEMAGMDHEGSMRGMLGDWSMAREGSGTSWLPDDSPMFMKPLGKWGRYEANLMGLFTFNYSDAGGKRGAEQFYSNSMPMLMLRRVTGGGIIGARVMASVDPVFTGRFGYPNLFQTGETAYGRPLEDRQHPHDLLSEVAVTYSKPIGGNVRAHAYLAPIGEPVIGGPMFLMRPSGQEIPESPIAHHWFDGTHITAGVATLGLSFGDKVRVESSVFNGREPDENRYSPDPVCFDSAAARLTLNPTRNLSFNVSYGFLKEPERLEAGEDQHRITAAAIYSKRLRGNDTLALGGYFGRNIKGGHHKATNAYVLEGTYYKGRNSFFARYEHAEKDELVGVPEGIYGINKVLFGATHNFARKDGFDFGLGAYTGLYSFPSSLEPFYGKTPVTLGVYLRIRPSRMSHDSASGSHGHGG
ncbi:hypothetical protein EON82_04565 [bacterium]|nr:MAG: hypothetical protein EON82_04565 [bacterium]